MSDDGDTPLPPGVPASLTEALQARLRQRRWGDRLEGAAIFGCWTDVVGDELARRCQPLRLAGGVLVIRADNAAWATQVRYLATHIVERADEVLRPGLVREVKVVVGPVTARRHDQS